MAKEPYNVAASNPAGEVGTLTAPPQGVQGAGRRRVRSARVHGAAAAVRAQPRLQPELVSSDVGSDPITLSGLLNSFAKKSGSFGSGLIQGIITDSYLPSLGGNDSWIAAASRRSTTSTFPKLPLDGNVLYGMSAAYTFVQALFKAGRNPTRQDLVNAVNGGLPQGARSAPYAYSSSDHDGITGAFMAEVENGALVSLGPTQVTDNTADRRCYHLFRRTAGGTS